MFIFLYFIIIIFNILYIIGNIINPIILNNDSYRKVDGRPTEGNTVAIVLGCNCHRIDFFLVVVCFSFISLRYEFSNLTANKGGPYHSPWIVCLSGSEGQIHQGYTSLGIT